MLRVGAIALTLWCGFNLLLALGSLVAVLLVGQLLSGRAVAGPTRSDAGASAP